MLGKLETVFSYTAHFILQSWPEKRPGILFLTDSGGRVINFMEMQVGPSRNSQGLTLQHDVSIGKVFDFIEEALSSKEIVVKTRSEMNNVCGAFPLCEEDGRVRAVIGMIAPEDQIQFDLSSYMRGLEPLIRMGYDAYIQHVTSQIVMDLTLHDTTKELLQSLTGQVSDIIQKGYCSAVKLADNATLIPQENVTTQEAEVGQTHIAQLVSRFGTTQIMPSILDDHRLVVVPVSLNQTPLYALFLHLPPEETDCVYDERDVAFLQEIGAKASCALWRSIMSDDLRREASKKDLLYQLMSKIQASIDVNDVLHEIVTSIPSLYPYLSAELFLTVEPNATTPVKQLSFQEVEPSTSTKAYLEGRLIAEEVGEGEQQVTVIAAPLLGKQGIYGVLQVTSDQRITLNQHEKDYISILADTAGTAFENAQLYQQSRNLIRELRLINEMARQLNRSLDLKEILDFVTTMMRATFDAEFCAILRKTPGEDCFDVLSSSIPAFNGMAIDSTEKPFQQILQNKQALLLAQPGAGPLPFSLFTCCSFMGVPLVVEGEISGVLLVADSRYHFFSFDDYKLLEIFGQHASLAMTNAVLHNEMERMVITDNLTGLYTRRHLNERVRGSLQKDNYGSLILIDIDYFKTVNDTFGHQVGDEVLIQVSNLIRHSIRDSDIAARWGGEELAVYLPRVDKNTAHSVAERIRECVEQETSPQVTISCGLAKWSREMDVNLSVEALFHQADIALYEAKNSGRNQVVLA
ncbi:sensor domain-containing diguanylate cyclase [Brevibacillus sp. MS2.2]|uniref:sensor domain-containing diguanylate cyclase n=1 Tax=Brevibacillus sp. MS2.2 TaxID=2738981 RepID=UPI00156AB1A6|nr:sensor domain-containing diguanylate cyclase [Brevibacillus sp. MS2.2]NRR24310.1 sensor domain-containing diguanylate cyclase [Brevibacillus sp. MS2.2]